MSVEERLAALTSFIEDGQYEEAINLIDEGISHFIIS
jgi:hypothetical protein